MDITNDPNLLELWYSKKCKHCNESIDELYLYSPPLKRYNGNTYCSQECLQKNLQALGFDGAVHAVHQKFGPDHPVTKQIQMMRRELKRYRKEYSCSLYRQDAEDHRSRNFYKNLRLSEKCL